MRPSVLLFRSERSKGPQRVFCCPMKANFGPRPTSSSTRPALTSCVSFCLFLVHSISCYLTPFPPMSSQFTPAPLRLYFQLSSCAVASLSLSLSHSLSLPPAYSATTTIYPPRKLFHHHPSTNSVYSNQLANSRSQLNSYNKIASKTAVL